MISDYFLYELRSFKSPASSTASPEKQLECSRSRKQALSVFEVNKLKTKCLPQSTAVAVSHKSLVHSRGFPPRDLNRTHAFFILLFEAVILLLFPFFFLASVGLNFEPIL